MAARHLLNHTALYLALALACAALSLAIVQTTQRPFVGVDDASIVLVYADHLARGEGFVFNLGSERVEGFTSLLWTLLLAPLSAFLDTPYVAIATLNVLLLSLGLWRVGVFLFRLPAADSTPRAGYRGRLLRPLAFALWVLLSPAFLVWAVLSLLETGLWSTLVLLLTVELMEFAHRGWRRSAHSIPFAVLIGLAVLTRPEALVLIAGMLLVLTLVWRRAGSDRVARRGVIGSWVVFLVSEMLLLGFRLAYFGFPFPNTYYAKISPDRSYLLGEGVDYFLDFLAWAPVAAIPAAACLLWGAQFLVRRPLLSASERRPRTALSEMRGACCLVIAMQLALPIVVGGDHFATFRFYQPVWPLLILPLLMLDPADASAGRPPVWRNRAWAAGIGLLLGAHLFLDRDGWIPTVQRGSELLHLESGITLRGRTTGRALEEIFAGTEFPTVGAVMVGGLKRSYGGEVVDLMGLNHIAMGHSDNPRTGQRNHAAFDKEVFWNVRPEVLCPRGFVGAKPGIIASMRSSRWLNRVLKRMLVDADFQASYRLAAIRRNESHFSLALFADATFLDRLQRDGRWVVQTFPHRDVDETKRAPASGG